MILFVSHFHSSRYRTGPPQSYTILLQQKRWNKRQSVGNIKDGKPANIVPFFTKPAHCESSGKRELIEVAIIHRSNSCRNERRKERKAGLKNCWMQLTCWQIEWWGRLDERNEVNINLCLSLFFFIVIFFTSKQISTIYAEQWN